MYSYIPPTTRAKKYLLSIALYHCMRDFICLGSVELWRTRSKWKILANSGIRTGNSQILSDRIGSVLWEYFFKVSVIPVLFMLGRDVEQLISNVETTLLISTSGKQPISMSFQRRHKRQISTLKQRRISTSYFNSGTSYFNVETTSYFNVETSYFNVKQCNISTLKQRHFSTLIRFNKIGCLFQRWSSTLFNVVSTCICLLGM